MGECRGRALWPCPAASGRFVLSATLAVEQGSRCGWWTEQGQGGRSVLGIWDAQPGGQCGAHTPPPTPGQAGHLWWDRLSAAACPPHASCRGLHRVDLCLGGVHGGPLSTPPALESSVGSALKSALATAPRPTPVYPTSSRLLAVSSTFPCRLLCHWPPARLALVSSPLLPPVVASWWLWRNRRALGPS